MPVMQALRQPAVAHHRVPPHQDGPGELARIIPRRGPQEFKQSRTISDDKLTLLSSYVENVSTGDEAIILSAEMKVRNPRSAPVLPEAPAILKAEVGTQSASIALRGSSSRGAKVYLIEHTTDPSGTTGWANGTECTHAQRSGRVGTGPALLAACDGLRRRRQKPLEPDRRARDRAVRANTAGRVAPTN